MTTITAKLTTALQSRLPSTGASRITGAVCAVVAGAALAWQGGWAAMVGAALVAVGAGLSRKASATARTAPDAPAPAEAAPQAPADDASAAGRQGAEVMVSQIVPVWSRQLELTRDAAADGVQGILQGFSGISELSGQLLDQLSAQAVVAAPGAVDQAVQTKAPAVDRLTAASRRAFDQRDAAVAQLRRTGEGLARLARHAKTARELAQHTRIVAFNASVESLRHGQGAEQASDGRHAVAAEVRTLAARMAETAEQIDVLVRELAVPVNEARRRAEVSDTTPDELKLEIDIAARDALRTLLASMGSALASSADLQQTTSALRDQLDESFVHFQFGDRVSQMLSIVANDMSNFAQWVEANPRATQTDAAQWLVALEAAYTMEEQRSEHHGNVHVQQSAGVEFF